MKKIYILGFLVSLLFAFGGCATSQSDAQPKSLSYDESADDEIVTTLSFEEDLEADRARLVDAFKDINYCSDVSECKSVGDVYGVKCGMYVNESELDVAHGLIEEVDALNEEEGIDYEPCPEVTEVQCVQNACEVQYELEVA